MIGLKRVQKHENTKAVIMNDLVRLLTIYGISRLLETTMFPDKGKFFNKIFLYGLLFIAAGTIIYHLCVKQFILFDDETTGENDSVYDGPDGLDNNNDESAAIGYNDAMYSDSGTMYNGL